MSESSGAEDIGEAEIPVLPSVGAQLLAARERAGLSVADIAQSLKIGARQVEALESGNWKALPGTTFIRGFVRNYARLAQLDSAPLMLQLDVLLVEKAPDLTLPEGTHVAMPGPGTVTHRRDLMVAAMGVGLVFVAGLIYFLLPDDLSQVKEKISSGMSVFSRPATEVEKPVIVVQSEPVLPPGATLNQVMNPQSAQAQPAEPVIQPPAPPPEVRAEAKSDAAAVPMTGTAALKIVFTKESWVEVRDRRGNVIHSQRGQVGSSKEIDGAGPLSLVIGYAPGVSLVYRGQAVDLTPHTKGDVARLTLE